MLGDTVCNQLLVSHLLMTFYAGDHHDSHGRYAVLMSGSMKLILLLGITRQAYSKKVVIITDRKCHDQVSDQEMGAKQNVSKHVVGPPTV